MPSSARAGGAAARRRAAAARRVSFIGGSRERRLSACAGAPASSCSSRRRPPFRAAPGASLARGTHPWTVRTRRRRQARMDLVVEVLLLSAGLFVGMLVLLEVGRRVGRARLARDHEGLAPGTGTLDAALFALLGLLVAFTFSGAAERFEDRRHLIREEANAIGTAYLRLDVASRGRPARAAGAVSPLSGHRIGTYRDVRHLAEVEAKLAAAEGPATGDLDGAPWRAASVRSPAPNTALILLPALNQMIDITTTRVVATRNHPPRVIFLAAGAAQPRRLAPGRLLDGRAASAGAGCTCWCSPRSCRCRCT